MKSEGINATLAILGQLSGVSKQCLDGSDLTKLSEELANFFKRYQPAAI
jgi:hypothetical protein